MVIDSSRKKVEQAAQDEEIYISTDIETDGPIPGIYSMISIGSVAMKKDGSIMDSFGANLSPMEGAREDEDTMKWWNQTEDRRAALASTRVNSLNPAAAMRNYSDWVSSLGGHPVFVGYPVGFDFMFVYWYLIRYTGHSPFSFSALDMKSYAMPILTNEYRHSSKKHMPRQWVGDEKELPHRAVEDARIQGEIFIRMRNSRGF